MSQQPLTILLIPCCIRFLSLSLSFCLCLCRTAHLDGQPLLKSLLFLLIVYYSVVKSKLSNTLYTLKQCFYYFYCYYYRLLYHALEFNTTHAVVIIQYNCLLFITIVYCSCISYFYFADTLFTSLLTLILRIINCIIIAGTSLESVDFVADSDSISSASVSGIKVYYPIPSSKQCCYCYYCYYYYYRLLYYLLEFNTIETGVLMDDCSGK